MKNEIIRYYNGGGCRTTHYAEWFLENDDLLERRIVDLRVFKDTLILDLE